MYFRIAKGSRVIWYGQMFTLNKDVRKGTEENIDKQALTFVINSKQYVNEISLAW